MLQVKEVWAMSEGMQLGGDGPHDGYDEAVFEC
jgi:hypothetical protein